MLCALPIFGCAGRVQPVNPCDRHDYGMYETDSGRLYEFQDAIVERTGPEILIVDSKEIIVDSATVEDAYFLANWAWQVPNIRARQTIEKTMDGLIEQSSD